MPDEVRDLAAAYIDGGWRVYIVPDGVDGKHQFFDAMVATFPLDPPLSRERDSWDALYDSLFGGLDALPDTQVAILWPEPLALADGDPAAYEIAVSILAALTQDLSDPENLGGDPPTTVVVALGR
jgi:hypothetical protein